MIHRIRNTKIVKEILILLGFSGLIIGLGTGFYSYFELKPKLEIFSEQIEQDLGAVEYAVQTLEGHPSLFAASVRGFHAGTKVLSLLPETLMSLSGTLIESSELLHASAATTRETKKGVVGLVLPQEELNASAVFMRKTAFQLRLMAKMMEQLRDASNDLAVSTSHISGQASDLISNIEPMTQLLQNTRNHLRNTRTAIASLSIPTHAGLAGITLGGLYVFLGILSFALAIFYGEVMQLVQSRVIHEKNENYQDKAA